MNTIRTPIRPACARARCPLVAGRKSPSLTRRDATCYSGHVKLKTIFIISWLILTTTAATAQPKIELPPEEPKPAIPRPPILQLQRESQIEVPLYEAPPPGASTAIGGYGELTLNAPS